MHQHPNLSYRSLELLCRKQAQLTVSVMARCELEGMALEYRRLADWLDRNDADHPERPKPV